MTEKNLLSLASKFFESRGYALKHNLKKMGFSGLFYTFDLIIKNRREERAVFVMDWRKTVGINMIIKADRATADVGLTHPIIIARKFSDHAWAYSNRKRIILITERDFLSKFGKKRIRINF